MLELLFDPFFVLCASATAMVLGAIFSEHWQRIRELEIEASLKQLMLERGMSARDIERVILASNRPPTGRGGDFEPNHRVRRAMPRQWSYKVRKHRLRSGYLSAFPHN
jgi:hypothetical protein